MTNLTQEIGAKIRFFRKKKEMTIDEIANLLCKSKATVSKYESGKITIDIVTLYEIAKILDVHVEQLLYNFPHESEKKILETAPAFFRNLSQFYVYYFDGRSNALNRCVVDVISETESHEYKIMMYMNIADYKHYQNCENTYWGFLKHYDAMSNLILQNRDTSMEQITISILASYLDAPVKWGLFFGFSSRPMMPVALKVMVSKKIQKEDAALIEALKISKNDIKFLKLYNMLTVIQ